MKPYFIKSCITALAVTIIAVSCNNKAKDPHKYMPSITGDAGDVLIVTSKANWNGEIGAATRDLLACDYPFLPQREVSFNLYNTSPKDFSGSFMLHRNIILINISQQITETGIKLSANAWAKPQTIITISAKEPQEALDIISENGELIYNTLEQAERDRLITNSKKYEDINVRNTVTKNFGGSPYFPKGFTIKKSTPEFIWISQETTYVNQGILIFKTPYTSDNNLSNEHIKQTLYDLWQANVPGMRENSYMTFNKLIEPGFKNISYNGQTMIEVRGLWEVENDYMGGPFVCHIFPDRQRQNLIILNAFLYAPKYDKRKYLRQVESIIYSFEWDSL